jgi:glycine betaine/proline transport system substrate-binding protein
MWRVFGLVLLLGLGLGSARADEPGCATIRSTDMGWTDIALTTNTAAILLKPLGYEMSNTLLGLNIAYESLKAGRMDVFLGNWRPVQDQEFAGYFDNHWVEVLGTNLTGAKYTLAVPDYVAAGGVHSFDDLAKFPDQFKQTIYSIEPGSNQVLVDAVAAGRHGLKGWRVVESSEQAMLAEVKRAVRRHEWVVFMGWQPHPMNLDLSLVYLTGGDAEYGPDFGGSSVRTVARPGFAAACPNLAKLFTNLVFDVDYENAGMKMIIDDGGEVAAVARALLQQHPDKVKAWLDGVTTRDGAPGLPAVEAALAR